MSLNNLYCVHVYVQPVILWYDVRVLPDVSGVMYIIPVHNFCRYVYITLITQFMVKYINFFDVKLTSKNRLTSKLTSKFYRKKMIFFLIIKRNSLL